VAPPRHAGFAAVATVTESTINDAVVSYARDAGPFFWPLPTSIGNVRIAGLVEVLPPGLELHPDPNDRVTAHFTFRSMLRTGTSGRRMTARTVQWTAAVQMALITTIEDDRIVVGIDTASVSFAPLQVTVLNGPPLPAAIRNALQSATLADSLTAFVRSLPPLTAAPPMLRAHISMTQGIDLPWVVGPNWFTVTLDASRIVVRPLEHALTVAVDFQGLTSGNAAQLVDLTTVAGGGVVYKYMITPDSDANLAAQVGKDDDGNTVVTWVDLGPPKLAASSEPAGGDVACVLNMNALSQVVKNQISPQISGTMIYPDIVLGHVSLRYAMFYKELAGVQTGVALDFHVTVQKGPWFGVDGTIFLQVYKQYPDGPTEFVVQMPELWRFYVGDAELDVPLWVDVAVAVLAIAFSVCFPLMSTMILGMAGALIFQVIPALAEGIEKQAEAGINSGANSHGIGARTSRPLPGLAAPLWNNAIKYVCANAEGIDLGVITYPAQDLLKEPMATIAPASWPASSRQPIRMTVTVRDDLAALAASLTVKWRVRRGDTWKTVATATKPYNDPSGNGVLIPHHSEALYLVDQFLVRCSLELTIGGQTGEIWSDGQIVSISDYLDRHHKYVEWGLHTVHFKNAGTGWRWWEHKRRSRIHRTAVSARCLMLRAVASEHAAAFTGEDPKHFSKVTYLDALPFSWQVLNNHRKVLCEYCFFGGPDKSTPFAEHDWF